MTEIEKQSLVLFKDEPLWRIKEMRVKKGLSDRELEIIEKALEYYRAYNRSKLEKKKQLA